MRYSIIENDEVVNITKASAPLADNWQENQGEQIGDVWDGEKFTRPAIPKPDAFEAKAAEVKEKVDERMEAGAPHDGKRWPANFESQMAKAAVAGSVGAGRGMPRNQPTITARDITRAKHEMTETEYLDMAVATRDYVFAIKENADDHVDALMALMADEAKTSDDIAAYDVTTGWPE